jgi:hypothetical protein
MHAFTPKATAALKNISRITAQYNPCVDESRSSSAIQMARLLASSWRGRQRGAMFPSVYGCALSLVQAARFSLSYPLPLHPEKARFSRRIQMPFQTPVISTSHASESLHTMKLRLSELVLYLGIRLIPKP